MARNLATTGWRKRFVSLCTDFATFVNVHTHGNFLITHALPWLGLTCAAAESLYSMVKEQEIVEERERAYQRRLQLYTSRKMECEEAKANLAEKLKIRDAYADFHKTTHGCVEV